MAESHTKGSKEDVCGKENREREKRLREHKVDWNVVGIHMPSDQEKKGFFAFDTNKLLTPQKEVFTRAICGMVKREKRSLTRVSGVLQAAPRDQENCLNKTNGAAGE